MVIDFYYIAFIIYARNFHATSAKRKSTARYSFPLPPVNVESHKKWRNKGSFYNNLQIHLDELILDVFWIVILWNCYENRQKIEINGFCSCIFFTAAQCFNLMRMNCMIALGAVKLINLWKSVLLVGVLEVEREDKGREGMFSRVIYCSDGNCVTSNAANCQRHTVVFNFNYRFTRGAGRETPAWWMKRNLHKNRAFHNFSESFAFIFINP